MLVCHSLGGPYIMNYTRRYPDEVEGLVFVDCSHPDQISRMPEKISDTMQVPVLFKVLSALSWTGVFQLLPEPDAPGMPDHIKPIGKAWLGETFNGTLKEMAAIPDILQQGGELRDLGDRPLVVLAAMGPISEELLAGEGLTVQDGLDMQAVWKELTADEATWSTRSRLQYVTDSQHYIQFQRPDLVIEAVTEVVNAVRAGPTDS